MKRKAVDDGSSPLKKQKENKWDDLCNDMWHLILSFTDTKDLFYRCNLVNKNWNDLIRHMTPLHLRFNSTGAWRSFSDTCSDSCLERVISLSIGNTSVYDKSGSNELLYKKVGLMSNLERLSILKFQTPKCIDTEHFITLKHLKHLDLKRSGITEEGVTHLCRLEHITSLDLSRNNISADIIMHLNMKKLKILKMETLTRPEYGCKYPSQFHVGLDELETLDIRYSHISDDCAKYISGLGSLKSLDLSCSRISLENSERLYRMGALESLSLACFEMEARCIVNIGLLTQLAYLNLSSCDVVGENIAHLSEMVQLRELKLNSCNIGYGGVSHLSKMTNLVSLELASSKIDHNDFVHLNKLRNLERLDLGSCEFEQAQVLDLPRLTSLKMNHSKSIEMGILCVKGLDKLAHLVLDNSCVNSQLMNLLMSWMDEGHLTCLKTLSVRNVWGISKARQMMQTLKNINVEY